MRTYLLPGALAAATALGCLLVLELGAPGPGAADALGTLAFGLILLAPPLLVAALFLAGAPPRVRILGALLPLAAWWLYETGLHTAQRGLAEGLFHGWFVLYLILYVFVLAEVAVVEAACRVVARLFGRDVRLASWRFLAFLASSVLLPVVVANAAFPLFGAWLWSYERVFLRDHLPLPAARPGALPEGSVAPPSVAPPAGRPPNVIVIFSDDHRADTAGYAGHPFVETPSLDRLAREGVRFERAFATTALCSPSRASFLTGQYAHRHGVFNNFTPWNDANRTFFEYLSQAGYATAFVGKWHMPGSLPELRGVDHFVTFTAVGGQGVYRNCPLVVDGREEASAKEYLAEELTDRALAFIDASVGDERPFAVWLAHKNVHAPFRPDRPEEGRYADRLVALADGVHAFTGFLKGQEVHLHLDSLESTARTYAEAVSSLDRQIGRVLDHLDELGVADETLVVYTSDQGYLLGEHGLVDKRWPYEESIRIPFLARGPGLPAGERRDELVLNVDLAPTLLDLVGVATPDHMDGSSLVPLFAAGGADWREDFYYFYPFEPPYPTPTVRAVRTATHKYVELEGDRPLLFDLGADPREMRDRAADPAYGDVRTDLAGRLAGWRARLGD